MHELRATFPARALVTPPLDRLLPPSPDQRDPQTPMQNPMAPVSPGPTGALHQPRAGTSEHAWVWARPLRFPTNNHASSRGRAPIARSWTLGDFLAAATKELNAALSAPGKRSRHPLDFTPRRGRSVVATPKTVAPPTAARRAQVQVLRMLGIVGTNQKISDAEMKAYDDLFAAPIPLSVLTAIAAMVDREIPACLVVQPTTPARVDIACET